MSRIQATERVQAIDPHGERVQAMFTDIAHGYDRANRLMSLGTDVRWRRRAVDGLLSRHGEATGDGEGSTILDLCAGTLDSTLEIHRRFPKADLIGGDFSAGMLEKGRQRLSGAAKERIVAKHMDAHELPEADESLDAIFCAFGVRNLSEVPRASREMYRCLKPGGKLTVLEFFRPAALSTRVFHGMYNKTVLPLVGWAMTGNLEAYLYLPRSIGDFVSVEEYQALLDDSGFVHVASQNLTMGVASIVTAIKPKPLPAPEELPS